MPKKFTSVNTKAVVAKARKAEAKELQSAKEKQVAEEAFWKDDDKQAIKKQQRKEEKEKKKQAQLDKKKEAKELLEKEHDSLGIKTKPPSKVTQAQIQMTAERRAKEAPAKPKVETHLTAPLEENINRLTIDGLEARTVDEALGILGNSDTPIDRHPERRMKAAYTAYEERMLPALMEEFPSLKLSQLKQKLRKQWQKSSDNPMNL